MCICSMNPCAVQHACYMRICSMNPCAVQHACYMCIYSMNPCAVQHACYMCICSMKACCACLVWAIHIHTHVTANQVPALYVLSVYNVIAGVDPDPSIQATNTFLSGLAINLTYVHHCTRLYLTRCNTVDSRYRRAQLSVLYREVPLIQR